MARVSFILICLYLTCTTHAQKDSVAYLQPIQFIAGSYVNFYVDGFENIYLLNANNQIKKITDKGDSLAVSNALKRFGDVYSMDVSNSLKIVVFYKDYTTIVVLDRFLKTLNTIDLRQDGIMQTQAVALSYDNNYWVFDEVDNKLKKVDDNGNILLSTPDFRTVFTEPFIPEKIIDYNGFVYLYNRKQGCKIFDYYGALKQSIEPLNWQYIQVFKNSLVGFDDSSIHVYNIPVFSSNTYVVNPPMNDALKLQQRSNNLYVLKKDGLYIYSIRN
jgi:hypothetical protein